MPFNANKGALRKQPCDRNCPRRAAGCAVSCPDWAEYLKRREADYQNRMERQRVKEAMQDGYNRLAQLARK